jgi:hypothetical protein
MADPPGAAAAPAADGWRPVVLVALLLIAVSTAPYVRATLSPPPGRAFEGFFWFSDDGYNYLSFVEQAERGAFRFRNKLYSAPHDASLVNLEWWGVGVLSRLLGGRPLDAYRVFGVAATFLLVAGIDHWLRRCGLPPGHRVAALVLVCTGGGLGGPRFLAGVPSPRCLDLSTGLFPFLEVMSNPHFTIGTALLLWSLALYAGAPTPARLAGAAAIATVLGLVRPYDLVLLVGIRGAALLVLGRGRFAGRDVAPLAALLPVVAYNAWVFYRVPAFAFYAAIPYEFPLRRDFAWALGPAVFLAAIALAAGRRAAASPPALAPGALAALVHMAAWIVFAAAVIVIRPVHFSLQFLVGIGIPALGAAALALARFPPVVTLAAAVPLAATAGTALAMVLQASPAWFVPAERMGIARALRADCRDGDLLVAPADIGLYAAGLTACRAYASHVVEPGHASRVADLRAFYAADDPAVRAAFLERACATHVVFPADAPPERYVGGSLRLEPVAAAGQPGRVLVAYRLPAACRTW